MLHSCDLTGGVQIRGKAKLYDCKVHDVRGGEAILVSGCDSPGDAVIERCVIERCESDGIYAVVQGVARQIISY